ncbi:MAG: hypothetical protein A2091_12520 [Desulfuromonadales bacterium GWD2_61_12]|nr:MAG: hypothetical protein A2005_02970 [Desulfuromonadales bacterium GWC2_61_20]OGR33154.1 MAG: hypothetical protein A2091_12520 [Desulfuromonadales bacterium GWD2_61_12]HAD03721.1 hypothetical protein [Desulfuromonas sp.]
MKRLLVVRFLVLLLLIATSAHAGSMRCGTYLVANGDTKADVLLKCGEPVAQSEHQEQLREGIDQAQEVRTTFVFNDWVYNFGPDRFMQIVTFMNGRVADIRSGSYGYAVNGSVDMCRDGQLLKAGDTAAEVELKCGAPVNRESRADSVIDKIDTHSSLKRTIAIEEWTYNFGPKKLILNLRFENGRLVKTETGGYGY